MKTNSKHLGLVTKKFNEFFLVDLKNKEKFTVIPHISSFLVKLTSQI